MTQQTSVVTPERFAQGLTYEQWMGRIDKNQARFEENYEGTKLSNADAQALRDAASKRGGGLKCLVIGEAWCPDVFRGLPVLARIAEAGEMELRIFFRDQNKDIMSEFLKEGEHESIPVGVFYTKDHQYIGHWIERPAQANEQMPELQKLTAPLRNPDTTAEERKELIQAYVDFQSGPVWAGWRDATVREVIALLQ